MIDVLDRIIEQFDAEGTFHPLTLEVDEASLDQLVKLRGNPQKFVPSLFDGTWFETGARAEVGPARLLRILTGRDGVSRAILRQGRALWIYPLV